MKSSESLEILNNSEEAERYEEIEGSKKSD